MTTFLTSDAALNDELDAMLAGLHDGSPVKGKSRYLAQKIKCIERSEKAMECDGDTVATINRLLDRAIDSLGNKSKHDARRTELMAVRHFHLPSLLDAFEVDTSRAH